MLTNKKCFANIVKQLLVILLLGFIINLTFDVIYKNIVYVAQWNLSECSDDFRAMKIDVSTDELKTAAQNINAQYGEYITVLNAVTDFNINKESLKCINASQFIRIRNRLIHMYPDEFKHMSQVYTALYADMKYFPIPISTNGFPWVSYVNSWGYERTYGGERTHEGTDIMTKNNIPGIYPVVSVCDGTIINKGWLELGGYRLGIASENGIYYYYAHMASYADGTDEGMAVKAGQFLGFAGNTGYSKVEGTSGKFDVHLHFGIYTNMGEGDISINPYYLLRGIENKTLYYNYGV